MMPQAYPSRPAEILFILLYSSSPLGTMEVSVVSANRSEAFFCPSCGDLWGAREDSGSELWWVRERPCIRHGDGSLLLDTDPVVALPRELMLRELRLAARRQEAVDA